MSLNRGILVSILTHILNISCLYSYFEIDLDIKTTGSHISTLQAQFTIYIEGPDGRRQFQTRYDLTDIPSTSATPQIKLSFNDQEPLKSGEWTKSIELKLLASNSCVGSVNYQNPKITDSFHQISVHFTGDVFRNGRILLVGNFNPFEEYCIQKCPYNTCVMNCSSLRKSQ